MALTRLRLDPGRCQGHGLCHWLAPDRLDLDEWGYPVVEAGALETARAVRRARRAVRACPAGALRLVEDEPA